MLFCSFVFTAASPLARKSNVASACLSFWKAASHIPWDWLFKLLTNSMHPGLAIDNAKICHAFLDFVIRQDAVLHLDEIKLPPHVLAHSILILGSVFQKKVNVSELVPDLGPTSCHHFAILDKSSIIFIPEV